MLLHELFEHAVERTPSALAACTSERTVSYAELNEAADRVATALRRDHGVGPGVLVALLQEASPDWLTAILGVLKAGGAYLPLDPAHGIERVRTVVADSRARLLILDDAGPRPGGYGAPTAQLPDLMTAGVAPADGGAETGRVHPLPQDLAYTIYTSGSTGRPKGVDVEHRNIVASVLARLDHYRANPEMLLLSFPPAFDGAISVMFWTLMGGGCVYFPPAIANRESAELLWAAGADRPVTDLCCVPSLYQLILEEGTPVSLRRLRRVIVAGDASRPGLLRAHAALAPQASLHNEYGPTEAAVWATVHDCEDPSAEQVPIGRAVWSATAHTLNAELRPVDVGGVGQLYLSGACVARGYRDAPGLTAERFIPLPGGGGERMYRTGDLVRLGVGGVLTFVGRDDHQIKWKGFRIEPGEIGARLAALDRVREVAVVLNTATGRRPALVGFLALQPGAEFAEKDVLAGLAGTLPPFMMPQRLVALDALPYTPNGKIDRNALSRIPVSACEAGMDEARHEPADEIEAQVALLLTEVLKVDLIPRDVDFFQLGADSLTIIRIASAAKRRGMPIAPREIFRSPTLAGVAGLVRAGARRPA